MPILSQSLYWPGAAVMALVSVPAQADVLELGADGARWVAGGPVETNAAPDTPATAIVIADAAPTEPGSRDPQLVTHSEATARGVPAAYAPKVAELAARYDLSPALIEALVWQESRWQHSAVSPKGARGLAQLMPGTARDLGVDPADPFANLEGGARYLREQLNRFDGDLEKALAAYNAGPGRVERAGGIPPIAETRQYVAAIMGRLNNYSNKEAR